MTPQSLTPQDQEAILRATLTHVPFEGWTMEAIKQGCVDAGFDPELAYWVFGGTPLGTVDAFFLATDEMMLKKMKEQDLASMRVRDRIALGVRVRLILLAPYKAAVGKTLTYLAHPTRAREGLSFVARTVSEIWYAAGDEATDFNYYSKRFLLAGVYMATLRYWLSDVSDDHKKTEDFLQERLDQVLQIPKIQKTIKDKIFGMRQCFSQGFKKRAR
jgi:ubiquinone biosynthesis protein COQ9